MSPAKGGDEAEVPGQERREATRPVAPFLDRMRSQLHEPGRAKSAALLTGTFGPLAVWYLSLAQVSPLTVSSLLADRLLQVSAGAGLFALVLIVVGAASTATYASAFVSLVGAALSSTVLIAGLRPPRDEMALSLAGLCLVICLFNFFRILPGLALLRRRAKSAAGTALVALALPALQFWHATSFVPSSLVTTLSVSPAFEVVEQTDTHVRGIASLEVTNVGGTRSRLIVSDLRVCAGSRPPTALEEQPADAECQTFEPIGELAWVDAKGSLTRRIATQTPPDKRFVQIVARVAHARGDRVREVLNSERIEASFGSCVKAKVVRLQEEAAYKALAQETKYLVYATKSSGERMYSFTSEDERACPRDSLKLGEYYGTTHTRVVWDGWIADEPVPTAPASQD